jgi:hypothetical protein
MMSDIAGWGHKRTSRHVRFHPSNDQIADITPGRRTGHQTNAHIQGEKSFDSTDYRPDGPPYKDFAGF